MKYEIKHMFTKTVLFVAEIDCDESTSDAQKTGLAVILAIKNGADLIGANLSDAYLGGADLIGAHLTDADLRGADLRGSDLRSANLRDADLSYADLSGSNLRRADLSNANLSYADLSHAHLRDADLIGANLSDAYLRSSNLIGANLSGADLRGADLRSSNLIGANLIDADLRRAVLTYASMRGSSFGKAPKIKNIHSSVYAEAKAEGALDMSCWHTCKTTHCRAGWVVNLAGKSGYDLEDRIGIPAAAAFIYMASDPDLEEIPNFYADNETALADMKRLAELEAA